MVAANEIHRVLISWGRCLSFAFLLLQFEEEGGVSFGDFDDFVILQVVESSVDREARIDGVLSLGEHIVGVEYATCGQNLKLELCTGVHGHEQLNGSFENDNYFIINLFFWVLFHVVQNVSLLHNLWNARIG